MIIIEFVPLCAMYNPEQCTVSRGRWIAPQSIRPLTQYVSLLQRV